MKKEARILHEKAVNSLVLAVEMFNRPYDEGRVEAVLMFLNHSFEMLLKAAILHKGGKIREPRKKETIGFDKCVNKALTEAKVKFLKEEQALTLNTINALRDAAEHHYVDMAEAQMYIHAQSALTLFKDIHKAVFASELELSLPERVLPLSTQMPSNIDTLFENEFDTIKKLLRPGTRKQIEAMSKLRGLSIINSVIQGERTQPTENELKGLCKQIAGGKTWADLFPGVAAIKIDATGTGPSLSLRFAKKEGIPIQISTDPAAPAVAIKRVNELDFYNLGYVQLKEKIDVTSDNVMHGFFIKHKVQENPDYFKVIAIGSQKHKRYSVRALDFIREQLPKEDSDELKRLYAERRR